ncbi:4164_t:CDS:1, partial [Rhizophagus irregularis]
REKNDKRRKEYWLIIDCIKLKSKVAVNGKKGFEYLVTVCGLLEKMKTKRLMN